MRLVSWNVNGLRAVLKKNFVEVFDQFEADVFALQETKCQHGQVELELPGYHQFYSYAQKKGYSGTAVFCKEEPLRVLHGIGDEYLDAEGRALALEFEKFWMVDVYTPNSQAGLARIDHRMQWDDAFRDFCKGLEAGVLPETDSDNRNGGNERGAQGDEHGSRRDGERSSRSSSLKKGIPRCDPKPVVMCGDFNVARLDIDLKHPDRHRGDSGFSDEERGKIEELVAAGFVDTFRHLHPNDTDRYSWWSYRFNARNTNAGWRLDYFFVSKSLESRVEGAWIYDEVTGSDHCPVGLDLDI